MSSPTLARDLAQLPAQELADTVTSALEQTVAARWGVSVGVLLRTLLTEDERVTELAGAPRQILDADVIHTDISLRSAAHAAVLALDMYDSSGVGQILGATGVNLREQASILRRRGVLLGIPGPRRSYLYPAFQFDTATGAVNPVAAAVNTTLDALDDPWAVGSWWASGNERLGGAAPWTLLRTGRQDDLLILAGVRTPTPAP